MPENADKKQGTKFAPGQSGNPAGKAKGTRNKTTLAIGSRASLVSSVAGVSLTMRGYLHLASRDKPQAA